MTIEDNDPQPPPGWRQGNQTYDEELFETTTPESSEQPSTSSGPTRPSPNLSAGLDATITHSPRSSSPESSDALAGLLGEVLKLASAGLTLAAKRRFGIDLKMQPQEARAAAKPIARLISRRVQIRRELSEATDATAVGASLMGYIERIASSRFEPPPIDRSVAMAPPAGAYVLGEEPILRPPPPAPVAPAVFIAEPRQEIHDQGGNAVPGAGPVRSSFLEGFEDV